MSTHNICFHRKIRKILVLLVVKRSLSRSMFLNLYILLDQVSKFNFSGDRSKLVAFFFFFKNKNRTELKLLD